MAEERLRLARLKIQATLGLKREVREGRRMLSLHLFDLGNAARQLLEPQGPPAGC